MRAVVLLPVKSLSLSAGVRFKVVGTLLIVGADDVLVDLSQLSLGGLNLRDSTWGLKIHTNGVAGQKCDSLGGSYSFQSFLFHRT